MANVFLPGQSVCCHFALSVKKLAKSSSSSWMAGRSHRRHDMHEGDEGGERRTTISGPLRHGHLPRGFLVQMP